MVGDGFNGCEVSRWFAKKEEKVTVVEALDRLMSFGEPVPHESRMMLIDLLRQNGVQLRTGRFLQLLTSKSAMLVDVQQRKEVLSSDSVVVAVGWLKSASSVMPGRLLRT